MAPTASRSQISSERSAAISQCSNASVSMGVESMRARARRTDLVAVPSSAHGDGFGLGGRVVLRTAAADVADRGLLPVCPSMPRPPCPDWTAAHTCEHVSVDWGSSGRRFKSCQPDAGQRGFRVFAAGLKRPVDTIPDTSHMGDGVATRVDAHVGVLAGGKGN